MKFSVRLPPRSLWPRQFVLALLGITAYHLLLNVGASSVRGKLPLNAAQNTVQSVNTNIARAWLTVPAQNNIQYLSFDTPIGTPAAQQCGRMVLSDIHVSSGDTSGPTKPFPSGCTTTSLSPQEKALIFFLFDLSNCLAPVVLG